MELILNTPTDVYVTAPGSVAPTDVVVFANGVAAAAPSVTKVGTSAQNIWKVTFTPISTGTYAVYANGSVQFTATCVTKSLYTTLLNLEDVAVGSWQWNKTTGILTLVRQTGITLGTYSVTDNANTASREKLN